MRDINIWFILQALEDNSSPQNVKKTASKSDPNGMVNILGKLEELFDLPPTDQEVAAAVPNFAENRALIQDIDQVIDKIDSALPAVRGPDATDQEMDELAGLATDSYRDLMDLGMQVDSRFASEIFSVASNMLGHAITAKTAKMDKKLKMIDLQLKKMRLDQQQSVIDAKAADAGTGESMQTAQGMVLSRNDLLERLLSKDQKDKKE